MKKLFTLGCSLTWNMGWKELLCEKYNMELVNSAMFGGSNDLQVRRIHSYIINDQINKDDIIIWQITSQLRHSFSIHADDTWQYQLDDVEVEDENAIYYIDAPINYFSEKIHKDVLPSHPLTRVASNYFDFNNSTEELISTIILLNNTYKILVIIGWDGALIESCNNYKKVINLLESNNVPHFKESYLSWAIRTNQPLADDFHPTMTTSEVYGEKVLSPKLQDLGWIK